MTPTERRQALETQADRIKLRLDGLNRQLSGEPDAWLKIVQQMPADVAEVVVDKAIAEERQLSLAYATIVKTLESLSSGPVATASEEEDPIEKARKDRETKLTLLQGGESA